MVTHAVPVAARLAGLPQIDLYLLPGKVRPTTHAAVGADTVAALADLRADVSFVATNGISIGHGLTTPDRDEAATKRAIVECARRTVVLADSTKIGVETSVRFAALTDIDILVTDSDIDRTNRRTSTRPESRWWSHDPDADSQPQHRPHGHAGRRAMPAGRCTGSPR